MDRFRFLKRTGVFSSALILNLAFIALFFMGSMFFFSRGTENFISVKDLVVEEGLNVGEKLYSEFRKSDEVRKDSPEILAMLNSYKVSKYDLSLHFNIAAKNVTGELIMKSASASDTLNKIYMNLYDNMEVTSVSFVKLAGTDDSSSDLQKISGWVDADFSQDNNYLVISSPEKLANGENFAVAVEYSGTPKKLGFDSFSMKEFYGNMTIYTLSEPNYAPVWWPCKDMPDNKALMEMHLWVPRGFKGVSNGLLVDTLQVNDSITTFNWKTSYPIATYLVSIVVTKLSYWEDTYRSLDGAKDMTLTFYPFVHDSAKSRADWSKTSSMIHFLANKFGEYPFLNEKYGMAEFGWTSGAMENQTLTSFGYLLMTGDNTYDNVVVHELSHQWFGDAVTLKDWRNIWLNEGFASYCEALWAENTKGKQGYFDYMKDFDMGYFSGTVYDPDGFIDSPPVYSTVYQKGAWVLHMLRGVLGDELFFSSLHEYVKQFKYKNAETSDLMAVFEQVSGQKLDWFFDEWVYKGTGRPKYEYSWKFEDFQGLNSGKYTVRLQLKQVQDDRSVYKMPIRIGIVSEGSTDTYSIFNDAREQSFDFVVNSKPKEIQIDRDGWILKKISKGQY